MERSEIRLKDINSPEEFIYIKVVAAVCEKFKVGDYVKFNNWDYEDMEGNEFDKPRWHPDETAIEYVQSNYWSVDTKRVYGQPIYKVTTALDGYLEVQEIPHPLAKNHRTRSNPEYLFYAHYVKDLICQIVEELDQETLVQEVIDNVIENAIILDPEYADSVIMDIPYTPYEVSSDGLNDKLIEARKTVANAERQIRSEAAKQGWQTRKHRELLAKLKAKKEAANVKRAATIAAKKKVAKKVKKKVSKK